MSAQENGQTTDQIEQILPPDQAEQIPGVTFEESDRVSVLGHPYLLLEVQEGDGIKPVAVLGRDDITNTIGFASINDVGFTQTFPLYDDTIMTLGRLRIPYTTGHIDVRTIDGDELTQKTSLKEEHRGLRFLLDEERDGMYAQHRLSLKDLVYAMAHPSVTRVPHEPTAGNETLVDPNGMDLVTTWVDSTGFKSDGSSQDVHHLLVFATGDESRMPSSAVWYSWFARSVDALVQAHIAQNTGVSSNFADEYINPDEVGWLRKFGDMLKRTFLEETEDEDVIEVDGIKVTKPSLSSESSVSDIASYFQALYAKLFAEKQTTPAVTYRSSEKDSRAHDFEKIFMASYLTKKVDGAFALDEDGNVRMIGDPNKFGVQVGGVTATDICALTEGSFYYVQNARLNRAENIWNTWKLSPVQYQSSVRDALSIAPLGEQDAAVMVHEEYYRYLLPSSIYDKTWLYTEESRTKDSDFNDKWKINAWNAISVYPFSRDAVIVQEPGRNNVYRLDGGVTSVKIDLDDMFVQSSQYIRGRGVCVAGTEKTNAPDKNWKVKLVNTARNEITKEIYLDGKDGMPRLGTTKDGNHMVILVGGLAADMRIHSFPIENWVGDTTRNAHTINDLAQLPGYKFTNVADHPELQEGLPDVDTKSLHVLPDPFDSSAVRIILGRTMFRMSV